MWVISLLNLLCRIRIIVSLRYRLVIVVEEDGAALELLVISEVTATFNVAIEDVTIRSWVASVLSDNFSHFSHRLSNLCVKWWKTSLDVVLVEISLD